MGIRKSQVLQYKITQVETNIYIYIYIYLDLSKYIHLWKQTWQWKITGANKNHESCECIHHNHRPHLANLREIIAKAEGTTCATWKNKLQVELVFVFLLIFWIHHHEKSIKIRHLVGRFLRFFPTTELLSQIARRSLSCLISATEPVTSLYDPHHGSMMYLEDHPSLCKWLGSPPFMSHLGHLEGEEPDLSGLINHGD